MHLSTKRRYCGSCGAVLLSDVGAYCDTLCETKARAPLVQERRELLQPMAYTDKAARFRDLEEGLKSTDLNHVRRLIVFFENEGATKSAKRLIDHAARLYAASSDPRRKRLQALAELKTDTRTERPVLPFNDDRFGPAQQHEALDVLRASPERWQTTDKQERIYWLLMNTCRDPSMLRAMATAFREKGFFVEAENLSRRAERVEIDSVYLPSSRGGFRGYAVDPSRLRP